MTVAGSDDEGRLERMRAELERGDERLAAFAGQVTHDLKTPLTTMSLSLELIRDELEDGAAAEDVLPLVTRALRGSARMLSMIEDVLAFSRIGTSIEPAPVDLARAAADVVASLGDRVDDVDMVVGELPVVPGDEGLLRSLLLNLLDNAVKFRSPDRPLRIAVSSTQLDGRWRIEVADNGVSIPDDQRDRVFEPMVRLDKRIEGMGIGLAACRRVVDAHGGSIGASANPAGPGSVFWIDLPS